MISPIMTQKTFYIVDGSSLIYRAYYAIRNLSTSGKMPTNAIYGFIQMLRKILNDKKPDYLVMAFDTKGPTFRDALYDHYKAHRPKMPDDLSVQIPFIHRAVSALGIFSIMQEGVEADDVIGTLAKQGEAAGLTITIVSGDKDLFQLISPTVTVYDTMKEKVFTEEVIRERFRVSPSQLIEIMGLMGDAVDNIPGVRGIGEKTAINLIAQFGTIETLLENLSTVYGKSVKEALQREQDMARLSRTLATVRTDCAIDFNLDLFEVRAPDTAQLLPLLRELEFTSLLKEFSVATADEQLPQAAFQPLGVTTSAVAAEGLQAVCPCVSYPMIDLSAFSQQQQTQNLSSVAIDLVIRENRPQLALCVARKDDSPFCLWVDLDAIPSSVKVILESPALLKIGHDMKQLQMACQKAGVILSSPIFDTLIAAYLVDPTRRDYSLATVALTYLQVQISSNKTEEMQEVLCQGASALMQLVEPLRARLGEYALLPLYTDVELPLIAVLAAIEQVGVKLDLAILTQISKDLDQKLTQRTAGIYALAGQEFNINSPKQLAHILFDVLGLSPLRKTKTGFSTDEDVLTQLAHRHELPAEILAQRQEMKLKSTYVDALPQLVSKEESRVHTRLNQAVTATGRLSSSDPNLQNIPIRGEWGRRIREAFIAEAGCLLLCADYNQIELRILAHLSKDAALVDAFCRGDDIHLQTAMEIFGLPKEAITKDMRRVGKTVNFGIVYGIRPFGLASNLGILQSEAKRYIDLYFAHFNGVRQFIDQTIIETGQKGFVQTVLGRRRAIPELASSNKNLREAGERLAVNTMIQGSAADIIKVAMIRIAQWIREAHLKSRMILQVHDELLFEVPEEEMVVMRPKVVSLMEEAIFLSVPMKVDVGVGANWWAAKG
jgi:DNA polymerase-1